MEPRFVDDMKNITVEVGQDATFICTVSEIHVSKTEEKVTIQNLSDLRATELDG